MPVAMMFHSLSENLTQDISTATGDPMVIATANTIEMVCRKAMPVVLPHPATGGNLVLSGIVCAPETAEMAGGG